MIVCLGDSITAERGGWPTLIAEATDVRAVTGARAEDVYGQVEAGAHAAIVCSVGINDVLAQDRPLTREPFAELGRYLSGMSERVAFLDVLGFAVPFMPVYGDLRARRDYVRAALPSTGCDIIKPMLPPWCWRRDRIHPNARGQARIAVAVAAWLARGR